MFDGDTRQFIYLSIPIDLFTSVIIIIKNDKYCNAKNIKNIKKEILQQKNEDLNICFKFINLNEIIHTNLKKLFNHKIKIEN